MPVYLVLDLLAAGYDFAKIIKAYPVLTHGDIVAALKFGEEKTLEKSFQSKVFA